MFYQRALRPKKQENPPKSGGFVKNQASDDAGDLTFAMCASYGGWL
jgi:hypothetical protein